MSSPHLLKLGPCTPENRLIKVPHPIKFYSENLINRQLENVAIANILQLEAARRHASPFRFNYDAIPSLKSLNLFITVL